MDFLIYIDYRFLINKEHKMKDSRIGSHQLTMDQLGFTPWDTGGGCMAYAKPLDHDRYILITDLGGEGLPTRRDQDIMIGFYDTDSNGIYIETKFSTILDGHINFLRY